MNNSPKIYNPKNSKNLVVVDVDMVLADNRKRLLESIGDSKKIDYTLLNSQKKVLADKTIAGAKSAITTIKEQKYKILYLTSRDESLTDTTRKWLEDNMSFKKTDELILVESQKSKINILKNYLDKIYLYIDDFKYDYQSGNPKISDHILPEIKQWSLPFVIFDNDWDNIIKKYFQPYD